MNIRIIPWQDCYAEDFKKLSLEWLEKYVEVEPRDVETIEHPQEVIFDNADKLMMYSDDVISSEIFGVRATNALRRTGDNSKE